MSYFSHPTTMNWENLCQKVLVLTIRSLLFHSLQFGMDISVCPFAYPILSDLILSKGN